MSKTVAELKQERTDLEEKIETARETLRTELSVTTKTYRQTEIALELMLEKKKRLDRLLAFT